MFLSTIFDLLNVWFVNKEVLEYKIGIKVSECL